MSTMTNGYTALEIFELALQQAPIKSVNQKENDVREAYPAIVQSLARKVPQKVILEKFNEAYGYTLHPPRFRKLLEDERKRRADAGDVAVCKECGQQLHRDEDITAKIQTTEEQ